MRESFDYLSPAFSVRFGPGRSAEVASAVAETGMRALVLATPQQADVAERIAAALGPAAAGIFAEARMHTPVEISERAAALVRQAGADCVVAVGGGSTIGLGKAVAARTGVHQVAIPTTYAGSEMTDILGETDGVDKRVRRDAKLQPGTVIYDVELTLSLPGSLSANSGVNAIAHAVEALYAGNGNPVISLMAEEGIRALAASLPAIVADPGDRAARTEAQYGAWLCAMCLRAVAMGLHHRLCHALGGRFELPHAETHAVVLPHAVAYNASATDQAMRRISRALGASDAVEGLFALNRRIGAPAALSALGMPEAGIDAVTDAVLAEPYANPRALERGPLRQTIADAWAGKQPRTG